jgi:hypothetical protein
MRSVSGVGCPAHCEGSNQRDQGQVAPRAGVYTALQRWSNRTFSGDGSTAASALPGETGSYGGQAAG